MKKIDIHSTVPNFISAALYMAVGIILRNHFAALMKYFYYITICAIILGLVRNILNIFSEEKSVNILEAILNFTLATLLIIRPYFLIDTIMLIISAYFLGLFVLHFITLIQRRRNGEKMGIGFGILTISEFLFAVKFFSSEYISLVNLNKLWGLYFISLSLCLILDGILALLPSRKARKKRLYIPLPTIFCAMLPGRILDSVNKFLRKTENNDETEENDISVSENTPDMEIFIHMADSMHGRLGHIDISFDNYVLSYGNYDESSYKLKGVIGEGVVEIINRDKYIKFCLGVANKHIVSFGIRLTEEEKNKFYEKIKDIFENLNPWKPPVLESHESVISSAKYELDYASSLYENTGALFYKFKDGKYNKFKTYSGFSTNCAALAEEITSSIGISLFDFSGILSPGTFYDYLNTEYKRKNSFVVSKTLYASTNK